MKSLSLLFLTLLLGYMLQPGQPVRANTSGGAPLLFPQTGHTLAYQFRDFFDQHGGLTLLGLPLTEVYLDAGRPVQYFERARLEWHADLLRVEASHLGRWAAQGKEALPAFQPVFESPPGGVLFAETRHTLQEPFLTFWQQQGGLEVAGYPLSEAFAETLLPDQPAVLVQYFERVRLEWWPNAAPESQIQVSHLGHAHLATYGAPAWAQQPVETAEQAWAGIRPTFISIPRIGVATDVTASGFSETRWDVPRYSAAHYWPVSAYPGTPGNIILAGHVGYAGIIFSNLPAVQVGDAIWLSTSDQQRQYVVDEILTLLPHETWVMNPTPTETLTLITCIPVGIYSHRLIVRASPVSDAG
ncbi:MAG: sortase [Chloroflexaceae bacterium]|nr:sortase [Chloroflexaceae bacterium]